MHSAIVMFTTTIIFGCTRVRTQMQELQLDYSPYVEGKQGYIDCVILTKGGNASLVLSLVRNQHATRVNVTQYKHDQSRYGVWETYLEYYFIPDRDLNTQPPTRFTCTATFKNQSLHKSHNISVLVLPTKLEMTVPAVSQVNTTLNATCEVKNVFRHFSLEWYLGGVQLAGAKRNSSNNDLSVNLLTTLALPLVPVYNKQNLTCRMQHHASKRDEVTQQLTVEYPPIVIAPSLNYTVVEDGAVSLECVVHSEPVSAVVWTKDGVPINRSSSHYIQRIIRQSTLSILDLEVADSGSYVCSATNTKGTTATGNITLDVTYRPKPFNMTSLVTALAGEIVHLNCSVMANPPVRNFIWMHENETLPENGVTLTVNTSDSHTAAGVYHCVAVNSVGRGKPIRVKVTIQEKKKPVSWLFVLSIAIPATLLSLFALVCCLVSRAFCKRKRHEQTGETVTPYFLPSRSPKQSRGKESPKPTKSLLPKPPSPKESPKPTTSLVPKPPKHRKSPDTPKRKHSKVKKTEKHPPNQAKPIDLRTRYAHLERSEKERIEKTGASKAQGKNITG